MTLNEFKAWLEGYEESFAEVHGSVCVGADAIGWSGVIPNPEQWVKIKEKLADVDMISQRSNAPVVIPTTWAQNQKADESYWLGSPNMRVSQPAPTYCGGPIRVDGKAAAGIKPTLSGGQAYSDDFNPER